MIYLINHLNTYSMRKNFSLTSLGKKQSRGILTTLAIIIFSGMVYLPMSCKKVDDTIDSALNFDGLFTSSDGWEVDLEGSSAKVTKEGTPRGTTGLGVGDYTMKGMSRTTDNSWSGTVLDENLENFVSGTATISNGVLTIKPSGSSSYSFTKKTTGSTGTPTVTPTPTGTVHDTLLDKYVDGSVRDWVTYYCTVGAGYTSLEIITTEGMVEGKNANHNTADLFVSVDPKKPSVTWSPYTWIADKSSTNINRVSESCIFSGTDKPAGKKFNILIYDNNTFFMCRLIVIATK